MIIVKFWNNCCVLFLQSYQQKRVYYYGAKEKPLRTETLMLTTFTSGNYWCVVVTKVSDDEFLHSFRSLDSWQFDQMKNFKWIYITSE